MSGFCLKHYEGKKKDEIRKTKIPKHIHQQGNWQKKKKICFETRKQRREIYILLPKVAYSEKNTKRKVNEKGGIDSLEKEHPKRRKHKDGKTYGNNEKRRKRKSEEEISSEEEFRNTTKKAEKKE